ncbi:MAG: NAD-binding protein [Caldilineaceae bacterium]
MPLRLNRRLWAAFSVATVLVLGGTAGYMLIEGWHWADALFMTVITLSTVGYGEVEPLTRSGRLFSMVLIVLGVGTVAYTFSAMADYIVAGELRGILRRQRMIREISKLRDHYIICGYGRVGRQVSAGLRAEGFEVVVIELQTTQVVTLEADLINHIVGDASDDNILEEAGIHHAKGLCACLAEDADNVMVTLSARTLNPKLFIIARSNTQSAEHKLIIAGANQVINPYHIAGNRMATQLTHPNVVEFLEVAMRRGDLELRIEEIVVGENAQLDGQTLAESHVRSETGVNVLAVRRSDGRLFLHLDREFTFHAHDALICLGTPEQLTQLAQRAAHHGRWMRLTHGVGK